MIETSKTGLTILHPAGGRSEVGWDDVTSIDLSVLDTMTTEVDFVTLNFDNGDFLEIQDTTEGFAAAVDVISEHFGIEPGIATLFGSMSASSPTVSAFSRARR